MKDVFKALGTPASIYLAVASDDSSIVYYKLSEGIVKPFVCCLTPNQRCSASQLCLKLNAGNTVGPRRGEFGEILTRCR